MIWYFWSTISPSASSRVAEFPVTVKLGGDHSAGGSVGRLNSGNTRSPGFDRGSEKRLSMTIAQQLQDIEVLDPEGAPQRLGSAWEDRTAVVVFIRHFG